jgi:small-conductance mechanosensitive channel
MYKLQISDLKAQLDDIKQTMQSDTFKLDNFNQVIMQELQHIKESDAVMKSDIENIKNTISKLLSQPTTTAPSTATPTTALSTAEPTNKPSTDNLSNLLNSEINNTTTDSDLLTQLTNEPQKVTVAVPKAPRGRRPRK